MQHQTVGRGEDDLLRSYQVRGGEVGRHRGGVEIVLAGGKLDRGALPVPAGLQPRQGGAYVPPETPIEELLAAIWSEVLVVDRVGIDDDFFELGGHSMLAVRMLARVQDAFGFAPYLGSLFDHSTIRKLAELLMLDMLADASEAELADLLEG